MAKLTKYQRNVALIALLMIVLDVALDVFSIYLDVWLWITPSWRYSFGSVALIIGVCAIIVYAIMGVPNDSDIHIS
jgi:uncharacterized membrane protein